jgi:hypothetical protein
MWAQDIGGPMKSYILIYKIKVKFLLFEGKGDYIKTRHSILKLHMKKNKKNKKCIIFYSECSIIFFLNGFSPKSEPKCSIILNPTTNPKTLDMT